MSKSTIIVAVLVVLGIGAVVAATQLGKESDDGMAGMNTRTGKDSSNKASSEQDLTGQKEISMDISDFEFEKANIKVTVGTKVTWTNMDGARHNVVTDGEGSEKLESELLAKGESYSYTFTKVGMTNYLCEPHPYMKGMINVVE